MALASARLPPSAARDRLSPPGTPQSAPGALAVRGPGRSLCGQSQSLSSGSFQSSGETDGRIITHTLNIHGKVQPTGEEGECGVTELVCLPPDRRSNRANVLFDFLLYHKTKHGIS